MVFDEQTENMRGRTVQTEAFGDVARKSSAGFGVIRLRVSFAGVVQQEGQVKDKRSFQVLKHLGVIAERRLLGCPDLVQLLNADQGVFVRGVPMKEFVVHQASEFPE